MDNVIVEILMGIPGISRHECSVLQQGTQILFVYSVWFAHFDVTNRIRIA